MNRSVNSTTTLKTAKITLIISIISFIGIFIPSILGMDGMNGGFAISAILIMVFLTTLISAIVFYRMVGQEKKIVTGKNTIAHWTYTDEEWKSFTEIDHKEDSGYKKLLFYMVAGFALFFGILFYVMDPESGIFVLGVMLGLIVLIGFVAFYSINVNYKRNLKSKGDVYISHDGVIINGQFNPWNIMGSRLEKMTYNEETSPKYIEFEYSYRARYGRQSNYVRVPVPKDEENKVDELAKKLYKNLNKS